MEAGKYYDCFAETAEIQTTEPKNGVYWVFLKVQYRFPESGKVMTFRHFLASHDIEKDTSELRTDQSGVAEKEKLEKRYGVDLTNFEFDQTKLSPDIIVQAKIVTDNYNGKTGLKIGGIYEKKEASKPVDKAALLRDFGSLFRATAQKRPAAPTVHAPNSAPPKASPPKATPPTPPKAPEAPKGSQGAEPPPHKAAPSTAEECWSLFRSLEGNKARTDNDVGPDFWDLIQRTFGHQQQERLTPADWGTLKEKIVAMETVPF